VELPQITQILLIHFFLGSATAGAFFKVGLATPPTLAGMPSLPKFSHLPSIEVGNCELVS
jgi:hypothetical protein